MPKREKDAHVQERKKTSFSSFLTVFFFSAYTENSSYGTLRLQSRNSKVSRSNLSLYVGEQVQYQNLQPQRVTLSFINTSLTQHQQKTNFTAVVLYCYIVILMKQSPVSSCRDVLQVRLVSPDKAVAANQTITGSHCLALVVIIYLFQDVNKSHPFYTPGTLSRKWC